MINSFHGEHEFMSNFYPVHVMMGWVIYPSVEHAYQAAKTNDLALRLRIRDCKTAGEAKRMGGKLEYSKAKWSEVKIGVMRQLLEQKFNKPHLRAMLLDTGSQDLVEGNYWGDIFWGVYNGKGKNHLGKLLMSIRNGIHMGLN